MPEKFQLSFPNVAGQAEMLELTIGGVLFVLGANGTGKSSLISHFFSQHSGRAKRISAHRQTWFTSNTLDMTPHSRDNIEKHIRSHDQQIHARYRQDYAAERTGLAIYDLIDADTMLERGIAALVRAHDLQGASEKAKTPAPLQVINELMRLSNIPIEISLQERQRIVAQRNGGAAYSVAELSDGERNAFLIAADVLTARPESLILIDEPERHLHRSIISPLLTLLFSQRSDCAFIVSTHELTLPVDNTSSTTLLVRSCDYQNSNATAWEADLLPPTAAIDDELKQDILGSRKRILFVEGTHQSLDAPMYSLLFPGVSVVPKASCKDVEYAVRGLRDAHDMHWVSAWGIVDNDRRSPDDIERLRELGVYALTHFSIEALYYHPEMVRQVALRQAKVTGEDGDQLSQRAVAAAVAAIGANKDHLVINAVKRAARRAVFENLPREEGLRNADRITIDIDLRPMRETEYAEFDQMIKDIDLLSLLARYPIRESGALRATSTALGLTRVNYESAVRKLLQEESEALDFLRGLFGNLPAATAI